MMNFARKLFSPPALLKLGLTLIAMNALARGLSDSAKEEFYSALFPVGLFGVLVAWLISFTQWTARRAWTTLLVVGFFFVFVQSAHLWNPIFETAKSLRGATIQLVHEVAEKKWEDIIVPEVSFEAVIVPTVNLVQSVFKWINTPSTENRPALEFIWSISMFTVAAWSAWMLAKKRNALIALAPSVTALALALYISAARSLPLQVEIFALFMLMGIDNRELHPVHSRGTTGEEKALNEAAMTLFLVSFGLTLFAGFAPSLSAAKINNAINKNIQESRNDSIAERLGLEVDSETFRVYSTNALPNEHLIGAPPALSNAVVFTVKTNELPPLSLSEMRDGNIVIPRHYWRTITFDIYTGHGWATTLTESRRYSANENIFENLPVVYETLTQEIQKSNDADARLIWSGQLLSVDKPFEIAWRLAPDAAISPLGMDMLGAVSNSQVYRARSSLPTATIEQMKSSPQNYPQRIRQTYLALPSSLPQRVRELAKELTANATNPYDKALALESFLRTYPYSLDVPIPPNDRDLTDYFLFDLKRGYCDYYATSMVVMARSVGLPARLVGGFASGVYSPKTATYTVRGKDAHSWVEIYFSGIGWIEFEPTAGQPSVTRPEPAQAREAINEPAFHSSANLVKTFSVFNPSFAIPLFSAALTFLAVVGALIYRNRRQKQRYESLVAYAYHRLLIQGRKLRLDSPVGETPSAFSRKFSERLQRVPRDTFAGKILIHAPSEIEQLVAFYIRDIYSPRPLNEQEQRQAEWIWRRLSLRLIVARMSGEL